MIPITAIPMDEIFTMDLNSIIDGFFVILKTLLLSIMNDFNFEILEGLCSCSSMKRLEKFGFINVINQ